MSNKDHPAIPARIGGIAGPITFAFSVVAAVDMAKSGAALAAGLAALAALAAFAVMSWSMRVRALDGRRRLPTPERARLRFQTVHVILVVVFVLCFAFVAPLASETDKVILSLAYAATPVFALAVLVAEFIRMIVMSDEMERRDHITASAAAAGALVVAATLWSVLQTGFPGLAALEGWVLLPAFAGLYALASVIIRRARP